MKNAIIACAFALVLMITAAALGYPYTQSHTTSPTPTPASGTLGDIAAHQRGLQIKTLAATTSPTSSSPSTATTTNATNRQSLLLSQELETISPQFVYDDQDHPYSLSPNLQEIKTNLIAMLGPELYSSLLLQAVSPRYILVSLPGPSVYHGALADAVTGHIFRNPFGDEGGYVTVGNTVLYFSSDDLSYYTLGASAFRELPNSKLPSNETYDPAGSSEAVVPDEKHSDTTLTISVFDTGDLHKVRDATFSIPEH